ncbi:carbohydrate porin [Terriglobus albidus]|uniref:Carbohydrate porin n=1 Tax=Terriglobus albidus TaxID=1592106 RepID=A0A5B9EDU7_9BACT|nr:carbohydrate porin [Terriglobus albidus]
MGGRTFWRRTTLASVARGLSMTLGLQYITSPGYNRDRPGYNRDRGPVLVPSVRTHVEF